MQKIKLLTLAVLAVVMLSALCVSSAFATDTTKFSLALASNQIQYDIPAGTTFNGSIATTGMVRFWVTAPNDAEIVNLGIIDEKSSFSFVSQQNGTYTFNFENDLPNTITVTFSYNADPQLPNTNMGAVPLTDFIIVGAVAVVGSILIFVGIRRKTKKVMAAYEKQQLQAKQSGGSTK